MNLPHRRKQGRKVPQARLNTRELISARKTSHKYNKDLSRLRQLSPGTRVNTRYINCTRGTSSGNFQAGLFNNTVTAPFQQMGLTFARMSYAVLRALKGLKAFENHPVLCVTSIFVWQNTSFYFRFLRDTHACLSCSK